jgi:hypothetical protein
MLWIFQLPEKSSDGIEPANSGARSQHANHYTTEAAISVLKNTAVRAKSDFAFTFLYHHTLSASEIQLKNADQAR